MSTHLHIEAVEPRANEGPYDHNELNDPNGEGHVYTYQDAEVHNSTQRELDASHTRLRQLLENMESAPGVQQALEELKIAESKAVSHREHAARMWQWFPVGKRPSARSAQIAEQVFRIPELLEHILSYLDSWDVLTSYRVNRTWNSIIEGSANLQMALGLREDPKGFYYSPIGGSLGDFGPRVAGFPGVSVWGIDCCSLYPSEPSTLDIKLEIDLEMLRECNFLIGSRLRAMQLCQPPIETVTAMVRFRKRDDWPEEEFHFEGGFTLGHLLNCTVYLSDMWTRKTGFSEMLIGFSANATLSEDDPIVKQHQRSETRLARELEEPITPIGEEH